MKTPIANTKATPDTTPIPRYKTGINMHNYPLLMVQCM